MGVSLADYYASTFRVTLNYRTPGGGTVYVYGDPITFGIEADVTHTSYGYPSYVNVYLRLDGGSELLGTITMDTGSSLSTTKYDLAVGTHSYYLTFRNPDNPFDSVSTSSYSFTVEEETEDIDFSISAPSDGSTHYTSESILFRAYLTTNVPGTVYLVIDGDAWTTWSIPASTGQTLTKYLTGSNIGEGSHEVYFKFVTSRSITYTTTRDFDITTPGAEEPTYYFGTELPANASVYEEGQTIRFQIALISNQAGDLDFYIDNAFVTGWSETGSDTEFYDTSALSIDNHTYKWSFTPDNASLEQINTTQKVVGVYAYVPITGEEYYLDPDVYDRRMAFNVTSDDDLGFIQIPIQVTYDADMDADFEDVRFTDINNALLSYWWENITASTEAWAWVKMNLSTGVNEFYMYYSSPGVSTTANGTATFEEYDDFNDGSFAWSTSGGGSWSESGGLLRGVGSSNAWGFAFLNDTYDDVRVKAMMNTAQTLYDHDSQGVVSRYQSASNWYDFWLSDDDLITRITDSGATINQTDQPGGASTNEWWIVELITNDTIMTSYINNTFNGRGTDSSYANGKMGVMMYETNVTFDWWFVAKYHYPEPTFDGWGDEEINVGTMAVTLTDPAENTTYTEGLIPAYIGAESPVKANLTLWFNNRLAYAHTIPLGGQSVTVDQDIEFWYPGTYTVMAKVQRLPIDTWAEGCDVLTGTGCYFCGGYLESPCPSVNDTHINVAIEPALSLTTLSPLGTTAWEGQTVNFGAMVSNYMANTSLTVYLRTFKDIDNDTSTENPWAQIGAWIIPAGAEDQELIASFSFPSGNYTYYWYVVGLPTGFKVYPDIDGAILNVQALVINMNPFTAMLSIVQDSITEQTGYGWLSLIATILFNPWFAVFVVFIVVGILTGSLDIGAIVGFGLACIFAILGWLPYSFGGLIAFAIIGIMFKYVGSGLT